jgi:cytidylate kinase
MEYLASDSVASAELFGELDESQTQWVNQQLALLKKRSMEKSTNLPENEDSKHGTLALFKVVLALGAKGRVILVGRGAHWILPESHTLRVRVVANLDDRVAYLAQTLRLSHTESMQRCRLRDQKRQDFAKQAFGSIIVDPNHFDIVLNSSRLGEDVSTHLIREAMQAKEGLGQMVLRP